MTNSSSNNKRIAVNTILLYIRMLFTMVISLYTSRVILQVLGASDFGIYNLVGGVVVLFSFLTNAMTSSTQRYLNYNLGLNDDSKVSHVFNTSILTHFTIFLIVFFLAETIGLWFVKTQLNIPEGRECATMWAYQMSIIATLIGIMVIPYRASIIAAEKMSIFAYISVIEVLLKLGIAFLLPHITYDSLIVYSILLSFVSLASLFIYQIECRRKLSFTKFHFEWDRKLYREMFSFSGWYLLGGVANVSAKQGTNLFINIFFNVTVNAAVGIANQVNNAVHGFVSSFQTAFNPQIVKLYATKDYSQLLSLIYRSSKFSYYLLFIISVPIILFCEDILSLWLVDVPDFAVIFTQLVIISSFPEALSAPLWTAIGATGKVNTYQLWVSLIILLNVPLVYIAFKFGMSPEIAFLINIIIGIIAYIYRLLYIKQYIHYSIKSYIKKVIFPCFIVTILTVPISYFLSQYGTSPVNTIILIIVTVIIASIITFSIGLDKSERIFVKSIINKIIKKNS